MEQFELPASLEAGPDTRLRTGNLSLPRAFGLGFATLGMGAGLIGAPVSLMAAGGLAWLVYGFSMVIIVALVVAVTHFSRRYVVTGSLMSYLGEAFGPAPGAIAGTALVVAYIIFCASAVIYPLAFAQGFLRDIHSGALERRGGHLVFFVVCVMAIGYVSYRGPRTSARLANLLTLFSLPFVLILFAALFLRTGIHFHYRSGRPDGREISAIIAGIVVFAGNYMGFEGFTALAAETSDPTRNIPRILSGLLAMLSVGYLFATLLATPVYLQHAGSLAAGTSPAAILADAAGTRWLKVPLDMALVLNLLAGLIPLLNDGSRVIATAGSVGIVPRWFSKIHETRHVPARALWFLVAVALVIPVVADLLSPQTPLQITFALMPAVFFLWMIPYMGMCVGLVVLRHREGRCFSIESLMGALGFALIAVLFCYQIVHPGSTVEFISSMLSLAVFGVLSVFTLVRLRIAGGME